MSRSPSVYAGKLLAVSPSSIQKANDCMRAWWFRYVMKRPEPPTKSQELGITIHKEIEEYLKTGVNGLGPIAQAGKQFIPEPREGLLIEHKSVGEIKVADVPVTMIIDLFDPVNEFVRDWKTTSNAKYIKPASEIADSIQMTLCGAYAIEQGLDEVALEHVYFITKGRPEARLVSAIRTADQIRKRLPIIEAKVEQIKSAAAEKTQEAVDFNSLACDSYGGCPHRSVCSVHTKKSLAEIFGKETAMSFLKKAQVQEAVETLKQVEASAKKGQGLTSQEKEAFDIVNASKYGFPGLTGDLAKRYAVTYDRDYQGEALVGSGQIGDLMFSTTEELLQLAKEISDEAASASQDDEVGIMPPDAPVSAPPIVEEPKPRPTGRPPGRPRKVVAESAVEKQPETTKPVEKQPKTAEAAEVKPAAPANAVLLWVNCVPMHAHSNLNGYIDSLCKRLCDEFNAVDIRCAPSDGPLGFGRWRGALAAAAREIPPEAGSYVVRRGELADIVIDALYDRVVAEGV